MALIINYFAFRLPRSTCEPGGIPGGICMVKEYAQVLFLSIIYIGL